MRVNLPKELDNGRPVVPNFIYTPCPGICPMMSAVFSQFRDRLGSERDRALMVSISIDPERDTPALEARGMSPKGRPKGEFRRAQPESIPVWALRRCSPRTGAWLLAGLAAWLLCSGAALAAAGADAAADTAIGEAIYGQGLLPGGQPLRGVREGGGSAEGLTAACVTCHRPSGLGSAEGRVVVPPIIGKYLFRSHSTNVHDMNLPHVAGYRTTREPYTAQTLARAIREGVAPNGRTLSVLMPRFALDDAAMASLTAYLTQMDSQPVPGVSDDVLNFATIVTPDADPVQRQAMLDVMARFFADKNEFIRGGRRPMVASREIEYRVSRRWQLHVWELTGAPEDWERQLRQRLAAEPIYAVVSGLGARNWAPVHRFCQRAALPCLFPNVELPVVAEGDFYPVYFSRGVLLEADLMAARLSAGTPRRLVQLVRDGDIGVAAAEALGQSARAAGWTVALRRLGAAAVADRQAELAGALSGLAFDDVLALWLRPQDLAALPAAPPSATVLLSGEMGGLEAAPLPVAWRDAALMSYPVDLPELRKVRMNFPLGWLKIHGLPVVAERVQADTYLACGILAETLTEMLDSFTREYLIERIEAMLSRRLVNGHYPRLSLASGQRFASKGGYLVRFAGPQGQRLILDGEWLVP